MRYVSISLALILALSGCGGNTPSPAPEPPKKTPNNPPSPPTPPPAPMTEEQKAAAAKKAEEEKAMAELRKEFERRPTPQVVKAETVLTATEPNEVVEQLGKAVADRKLQAVWEMLPTKYQTELNGVIADFGKRVDPALWTNVTSVVQAAVVAAKRQKERFLAHPISSNLPVPKETMEKMWDPAVAIGDAILESQLYAPETLKTFDVPAFLATTGSKVLDHLPALAEASGNSDMHDNAMILSSLKTVKASKVSGDENTAVVKIELEGQPPSDVEFVKVEGKWIPKALEEQWPSIIKQLQDLVAMVPASTEGTEDKKKEISNMNLILSLAKASLFALAASNTDKKFDDTLRALWKTAVKTDFPGDVKKEAPPAEPAKAAPTDPAKPAEAETPKPEAPAAEPKAEEPKPEEPKAEEVKPEEPKPAEEPKVEEPKPEEPKAEEPKVDEPKPEEPKVEEPKPEEPKPTEPAAP